MTPTKSIKQSIAEHMAEIAKRPPPPPLVTYTKKTITQDYAEASLTTDDRDSGHTVVTLRIRGFASDCITVGEDEIDDPSDASNEITISFHYGMEGTAILDVLKELFK